MKPFPLDQILDFWLQFISIVMNFFILMVLVPAFTLRQLLTLFVEQALLPLERAGQKRLSALRGEISGYQNPIR